MLFKLPTRIAVVVLIGVLPPISGCAEHSAARKPLAPAQPFIAVPLKSPVPNDAVEQRLAVRPDGGITVLWWQNLPNGKYTVQVSALAGDTWTSPSQVTDMPNVVDAQLVSIGNDTLAAMWMVSIPVKNMGGEVQELYVARGDKQGKRWGSPIKLDQRSSLSNKVSPVLAALADGSLLATWIDVPSMAAIPSNSQDGAEATENAASLMVARVANDNASVKRISADNQFCTCCGPALVADGQDGLLAYRDLQGDNIRDPAFIRVFQDSFSPSAIVHDDRWKIDGCPSSGPVISRFDQSVGIAWLTSIKDRYVARMAFSHDNGRHFEVPVDLGTDISSVNGIEMDSPHSALVAWTGRALTLARVYDDGRIAHCTHVLERHDGNAFKWPGPRMAKTNDDVFVAWNDEQSKKLGIVKVKVSE